MNKFNLYIHRLKNADTHCSWWEVDTKNNDEKALFFTETKEQALEYIKRNKEFYAKDGGLYCQEWITDGKGSVPKPIGDKYDR